MESNEPSTEYKRIAAQLANAKAIKEKETEVGLPPDAEIAKAAKQKELRFKASHGLLILVFLWIFLLHAAGIYLFSKGFLLTRLVLEHKSECVHPPIALGTRQSSNLAIDGCWHPKSFDKAVVIIVDALRYDFTVPFEPSKTGSAAHHFHNALPLFYETATQQPNNAFLLPFIADPPTTTLQRLKGLTTGTLPTFIDAGSNFAGTAIEEDNLVAQLRDAGKNLVHLGDDTWHSLFPGYFDANMTHAYDSFNVWDLHTVDDGVSRHLLPLLHPSNTSRWDVLFGHYLGVDHAGHRYGPDHPAMTMKLQQMDGIFREVIALLDDKTLLVVMGDHGMDVKGDHGGESDDEVEAALWMYSRKGIFGRTTPEYVEPPQTAKNRPVGQIDLVPTLALLLGIPIPFNNLGAPIEEAFAGKDGHDWENLARVNRLAGAQIERYQHEYAIARRLDKSTTSGPLALWKAALEHWDVVGQIKRPNANNWQEVYMSFSAYQKETLKVCRSLWASFSVPSMLHGIGMLLASVVLLVMYSRGVSGDLSGLTPALLEKVSVGTVVGLGFGCGLGFYPAIPFVDGALFGAAGGGILGFASTALVIPHGLLRPWPVSLWGWLAVILTMSQSIGFASNSYTIWEDEILLFFLTTFGILTLMSSLRQSNVTDRALGTYHSGLFVVLTRLASLSRLCREEQMPYCKSTYYASTTSSTSAPWQLLIPFVMAIFLPDIIKSYYQGTRSYFGSAVFWIGFATRIGLLLTAVFWVVDSADDGDWTSIDKGTLRNARVILAQVVLAIAFVAGSANFAWAQPCVNIEQTADPRTQASGASAPKTAVIVLGYANVHGSRYSLLVTNWLLAITLLQKPMGAGAMGILFWQILSLLEIIDTNNLSQSAIGPVILGLLGSFHFFKTGHQATLSSIQWESAFVPLQSVQYPWSPLLVVLNTFGAQILAAVAVPLVVLWKQPPKKPGLLGDVAKAVATHMLYCAVISLATTMWAGWLRRHLMLYRIFSPRFMMGAVVLLVVDLVAILVGIGGLRWNMLSVAEVFGWA
ncbi:MAG: mannose-ethanolamine phosphotransferase gpi13 [Pycnora praestabilis]|nr:MAG: mannose-ethanolamine phosphotransferase gpi13 [Pycnora praestabilis]